VDLPAALRSLAELGITGLMVEGGAQVITSFLTLSLADYLIVTVAPLLAGGLNALATPLATTAGDLVRLRDARWEAYGDDMVIGGWPQFGAGEQA
jgi:riboflavin biosynthesis pyrimidine reductase